MASFRDQFGRLEWVVSGNALLRLPNDVRQVQRVAAFLSEHAVTIGRCAPERETHVATALAEAISNAILHGNLEISSELRDNDEMYCATINERRNASPYRDRVVEITVDVFDNGIAWTVSDEGAGFDLTLVPDPTLGRNVYRCCGRGLLLMRRYVDEIVFHPPGNRVTMTVRRRNA